MTAPLALPKNEETPQEDVRNALAILEMSGGWTSDPEAGVMSSITFAAADYHSICARLYAAVSKLEGK